MRRRLQYSKWSLFKVVEIMQCHDRQFDDKLSYENTPPGTTSLLLQVNGCSLNNIQQWTREWMRDFVFSSQGTTSVPLSMNAQGDSSALTFYGSDGEARGSLSFIMTVQEGKSEEEKILIHVTSTSRFLNLTGTYASYLPGERRIIRSFVSNIHNRFGQERDFAVLYKAPHIRLRQYDFCKSAENNLPVTVLVAELREATASSAVSSLRQWAFDIQYGTKNIGLFANARLPPISTKAVKMGVRIFLSSPQTPNFVYSTKSQLDREYSVTATIREKVVRTFRTSSEGIRTERDELHRLILLVTATRPSTDATQIILKR